MDDNNDSNRGPERSTDLPIRAKDYKLPPPLTYRRTPNEVHREKWTQDGLKRAPIRAIAIKGDQLRAAMRSGKQLDWGDIHERYIDLWQECRLAIWRAKHEKQGVKTWDPQREKNVQTFAIDENLILHAIEVTRGVLDSVVRLRREMGHEATGIPRWAVERIERALRDHPDALNALLKELAAENSQQAE